jgi:site-specific DNA recombinase
MTEKIDKNSYLFYVRVSSKDQAEGASIPEQERQIREYAKRNNLQLAPTPYKEVESAKENNRPIFNQMVADLRKFGGMGIIFHKIDRASRNFKDAALFDDLISEGYIFHFVSDGIASNQPNWRLAGVQFGFAKFYIDNLKQEIHKGINGMVDEGRCPMPAPIGYLNVGKGNKSPDPDNGPIIRKAFEIFSRGNTSIDELHKIVTRMGLRSHPTLKRPSKPIVAKGLYKILRNPFYYGLFWFKGELKPGSFEPIISKALFDKVQQVLDGKSFKHKRTFTYLFGGMLRCPVCAKPLRAISSKGKYKYYSCRDLTCKTNLKEEDVEDAFIPQLRQLEFNDKEAAHYLQAVERFRKDLVLNRETDIKHVDLELTKLRQEKDRLLSLTLEGTVSDEDYKRKSSELVNKDRDLIERRMALEKADTNIMDHIAEIGKLLKKPSLAYGMASEDKKRNLIKSLVENLIWVPENDHKTLTVVWKNDFQPIANRNKVSFGGAELLRWKTALAMVSQIYSALVNSSNVLALSTV